MKKSGKRILTILLSIMIIMTYMVPGSVFADTAGASEESATAEVHEHDHAIEELTEGDDGADAVISNEEDPPEETVGEVIEEVPDAPEAEEPAEEVTEEPAEELPVVEETVTIKAAPKAADATADTPAVKAAGGLTVLAFTSDTHNQNGNVAANRIGTWLQKMIGIYGAVDIMGFGGDMASASINGSEYWTYTQADINAVENKGIDAVYTTGNHEYMNGSYTNGSNSTTKQFIEDQEAINADTYRMYALGSGSYANGGGWNTYDSQQISKLSTYLNGVGSDKPIFIITHYPLHWTSSRSITGAGELIDLLNAEAAKGKKIVFLWGHNHTDVRANDSGAETHYDEVFAPEDELQYSSSAKKTIQFYYGAAGCMSDTEYTGGSRYVMGKGLLVTINNKQQLSFTYYDENANNVTENGSEGQGTSFTEQDPVYAESMSLSAQTATVEVGRTLKPNLTVSFQPEDTNFKAVTWTSNNPSVASVDSSGKVKGVSAGTATITAIYALEGSNLSASCTVEVVPRTTSDPEYVIRIGDYALSTEHSSDSYSSGSSGWGGSTNTYNGMVAVPYTAGSGADDSIRWILEESDDGNGYYIKSSDDRYLNATYESSGSSWYGGNSTSDLKLDDTPDVWTFDGDLDDWLVDGSKLKSANTDRYLAEVTGSAGTHIITTRSSDSAATTIGELASDPVAVTGVSVTPATATVEARKSVQLTATVTPADATNKKVTWSSDTPSVATVDANGKVRGVSEGTAVITAASVDNPGITASATVTVTPSTSTVQHYVIMVDGNALTTDRSPNTANGGSSSYTYTGLAGAPLTDPTQADDNMRFIFEETSGGYYIMDLDGNYLNATYTSGSSSGKGDLKLDSTPDVWVLDSGYSLENGTVDGSKLKSTNASGTATSDKFLSYEDSANLFSVRSSGNADEITIEEASDPVAVTGVTVSPKTATVEAKKTTNLTATVVPENATNKKVTWSSSNPSVATVDENGKVKGVSEGTAAITATTVDGGMKDTCAVTVTPSTSTETHYVIVIDGFALSTDRSPNTAQGGSSSYTYTGLAGVAYTSGDDPDDNISWIIEETEGGYYIKDIEGNYLNATYTSGSNSGKGDLKVDSTPDVWSIEGTLEDWMVDGSKLKSANASATATSDKFLSYEDSQNLFSVRSTDNADESTLVDPSVTIEERFVETNSFENGKEYIIAVTKDSSSVYAVKNITGTSTGNTGSVTLKVTPASGSDPAYIVTDDEGVIWKYSSSNQYLTTSNSHYLGYESSSYNPRVSSQGRAIAYSGGRLTITSSRYLTCDNGTFGTSTSSSNAATVRIFVKTVAIVACDHEYGEPTWTWTGNVKSRAAVTATATFTCTKCGETLVVPAEVTTETDEHGDEFYTATVTGPDGVTYTDTKYKAEDKQYHITITADKEGAAVGEEVTFTITLGPVDRFGSFQMTLVIPEGLTFNSFEAAAGLKETLGFDGVDWTASTMFFNGYGTSDYSSDTDTVLATFKCTVNSGFTGSATLGITDFEVLSVKTWENLSDLYDIIPATLGAHTHTMTAHAAVAATCTTAGNSAYWSCDGCGKYFSDAQGTTEIAADSWVISALGHTMTAHAATAATCTTAGNSAYWSCSVCGKYFSDAQGATEIAADSWVIAATGHTMTAHAAVAATCTEAGNSAYWSCSVCGKYFSDAQGATEIAADSWVIAALGHNMTAHAATAATCEAAGNTAYWSCDRCSKYFSDAQGTTEIAADSWVIAATGHDWEFKTFTWTETTNGYTAVANYQCKNDADHTTTANATVTAESTSGSCETPGQVVYTATITAADSPDKAEHTATKTVDSTAPGHDLTAHAAVAATCTEAGNSAYWKCERCGKFFSDELGTTEIEENSWVISALGHNMTAHAATEATCEAAGNTAYWSCERCGKFFSDEQGTTEIAENSWVIAALDHDWQFVNFTWTGSDEAGYTAAVANYRCKNDSEHTRTVEVTVALETTDPTCDKAGSKVYTATVAEADSPDGIAHTDTKTVVLPASGHDWEFVDFTWTGSDEAGYTAAVANYKCKNNEEHIQTVNAEFATETTAAGCEEDGQTVYTAAVSAENSLDNALHNDSKTVVIPASGHVWIEPASWTWIGDDETGYTEVKGTFTCQNDSTHTQTVGSTDITVVKVEPTPTQSGSNTYSAKVTGPDNIVYSIQKEIVVPPAGYTFKDPVYTWTETADGYSVTALKECNEDHALDITETVTASYAVTTPASCEADGVGTYTAAFTNSAFETQTKEVDIEATGHNYGELIAESPATCTADGVKAHYECGTCHKLFDADKKETTEEALKIVALGHNMTAHAAVAATCETAGNSAYWSCDRCGKYFSDAEGKTAIEADSWKIPATGHTIVTDPGKAATCVETGLTEGSHCSVCGKVLVAQEEIPLTQHSWGEPEVIKEPVYLTPGLFKYTCTVCGEVIERNNGWVKEPGVWIWRFIKDTGEWASGEWVYDNKGWCWIMEDGICAVDTWFEDPETGNLYYLEHGGYIARNEWVKDGKEWYYMNADGLITKNGWAKDSTGWCWMGADGKITKSKWIKDGGEWYYLKADGYMAANEWAKDSTGWCWMGADGKITKSKWILYKGEWYYLKANGYMAASEWTKDSKGWMYMDGSGKITKSKWIQYKGDWYYLKADGYMATGTQTIDGKTYRFDSSGRWIS